MSELNDRLPCPHCGSNKWDAYQQSELLKAEGECIDCGHTFDIEKAARALMQLEMGRLCPEDILYRIRVRKAAENTTENNEDE